MTPSEIEQARTYFYPKTATLVRDKKSSAVAAIYEDARGAAYACLFYGKARKPSKHYRYCSVERRNDAVAEWFANIRGSEAIRQQWKAERKAKGRDLEVGDVLRASWGYDQTNIDFYEVTALIGRSMVEVRAIAQESKETGFMQGECAPCPGSYIGEPMRRVAKSGSVKIDDVRHASKVAYKDVAGVRLYGTSHWTAYA